MSSNDFEFDINDIFKIENLTCDNYHYISRITSENLKQIENFLIECLNRKSSKELLFRQFYLACFWGFRDIARTILDRNPNININQANETSLWTPLHASTFQEHIKIFPFNQADVSARDTQQRTPIDFASASSVIWPHFAVLQIPRVSKRELVNRQIYSRSEIDSVYYDKKSIKSLGNIKFAPYQMSKRDLDSLNSDSFNSAYTDGDVLANFESTDDSASDHLSTSRSPSRRKSNDPHFNIWK
ncbi:ankyrin repeat domain-containing 49-like [Brachionus plicatilis]|uniref:Ankyrin repeat domain-containing 49-like n=1 Tax=Brachionus plicatilis TaxID=10195 RepID=A0A3M7R505_BRAPC|nr:ankyrin repeat domain-containing 49-like [Brachionus plicatilis]